MFNLVSKKLSLFFLILTAIFIANSNVYAGTLSCEVTSTASCTGTIIYKMSDWKDAHAALYDQTGTGYDNNAVCCTGVTGLSNSCSGTYATVLKLSGTKNAHVQQTGSYANNVCLSVPSGNTISIGYQSSNCRGYDTILGSMSDTTNAQIGDGTAYTTKICGTAAITPVISISVDNGIISYGTLAANTSISTSELSQTQTINNNSNVAIDVDIRGYDTNCWLLSSTAGKKRYVHTYCKTTDVSCSNPPTNYNDLPWWEYDTLYENIPAGGTKKFDTRITVPTETSCFTPQSVNITLLATEHAFACGETVTFPYNGKTVTYGTVKSPTGKCFMDRNLGANQVATAYNDSLSYGDYFQWGRLDDGHQLSTSAKTTTLATTYNPLNNLFIYAGGSESLHDWLSTPNNNLWQGESGINNPCPPGWRLPTLNEWSDEKSTGGWTNNISIYNSVLKLPAAGYRWFYNGAITTNGYYGKYWSSSIYDNESSYYLYFDQNNHPGIYSYDRGDGYSVRCIKN